LAENQASMAEAAEGAGGEPAPRKSSRSRATPTAVREPSTRVAELSNRRAGAAADGPPEPDSAAVMTPSPWVAPWVPLDVRVRMRQRGAGPAGDSEHRVS